MPSTAPTTRSILRLSSYGSTDDDRAEIDSAFDNLSIDTGELSYLEGSTSPPRPNRPAVNGGSDSPPPTTVSTSNTKDGCAMSTAAATTTTSTRSQMNRPRRQRPRNKAPTRQAPTRTISFSEEEDDVQVIPILPRSKSAELFYDDEEIAGFRHEKFMEDAGLDPVTYEPLPLW